MHDEDVQVLFDVVYVDAFLLVVRRYSMHYYQWVYQVDVPNKIKELILKRSKKYFLTAFFGGAFICGGNGGTRIIKNH